VERGIVIGKRKETGGRGKRMGLNVYSMSGPD
jgi:hypothetical protein